MDSSNDTIFANPFLATRAHARTSDPDTSHQAAGVTSARIKEAQVAVLRVLRMIGPATDEELREAYDQNRLVFEPPQPGHSSVRSRRKELEDAGLVVWTGEKRRVGTTNIPKRIYKVVE